eukprot:CAMPEP_0116913202 /NCGR_PEP_ID=MMETSP0467-20121206/16555_1 /TAXON_ID=283647 /ORGANISM="Mesodinium pulex, Strain SPMC105" /LENGTH=137 /DNA_ID=CAMNT_0004589355 /DNA_START=248 /DNA_END=661 /DNA_ORIENTATION=+
MKNMQDMFVLMSKLNGATDVIKNKVIDVDTSVKSMTFEIQSIREIISSHNQDIINLKDVADKHNGRIEDLEREFRELKELFDKGGKTDGGFKTKGKDPKKPCFITFKNWQYSGTSPIDHFKQWGMREHFKDKVSKIE